MHIFLSASSQINIRSTALRANKLNAVAVYYKYNSLLSEAFSFLSHYLNKIGFEIDKTLELQKTKVTAKWKNTVKLIKVIRQIIISFSHFFFISLWGGSASGSQNPLTKSNKKRARKDAIICLIT